SFLAVRDPLTLPYDDATGRPHPDGAAADLAAADSPEAKAAIVRSVLEWAPARRTVFGDRNHLVAVTVTLDIPPGEFARWRPAGRDHATANREAFTILGWPAFMTGLATLAGFAALGPASMTAISSFGLCTAAGVLIVYCTNWVIVPAMIHLFYRRSPATA